MRPNRSYRPFLAGVEMPRGGHARINLEAYVPGEVLHIVPLDDNVLGLIASVDYFDHDG